jgi:hypothetical protein
MVHKQRGESSEAEKCWRLILTLKRPDQFCSVDQGIYGHLTRRNLAVLAAERGDQAEVRRLWEAVLAECPGDREALDRRGWARFKRNRRTSTSIEIVSRNRSVGESDQSRYMMRPAQPERARDAKRGTGDASGDHARVLRHGRKLFSGINLARSVTLVTLVTQNRGPFTGGSD